MSLALFIARRSALSSRRADGSRASRSPAVGVAVAAVALSICVMLCSIAIVAGFKDHITGKLAGFNAHLQVYRIVDDSALQPDNLITLTPTLRGILDVKIMMLYSFIAYFIISLSASYLFGFIMNGGLPGIWMAFPLGLTSAGIMFCLRFLYKTRKTA